MENLGLLFPTLGAALTLFCLKLEFQGLSIMLATELISFGVKNQAPQVSFKFAIGYSMSVYYYEFDDIKFFVSLDILEAISDYGAQAFALHGPRTSLPFYLITCSSPHRTSKDRNIMHSHGVDFTSHGSMFKAATYQFLGFTSHGSNF